MGGSRFLSIQHCAGYQLTPLFLFQMVMLKGTGGGRVFQMHWIFNKRGCFSQSPVRMFFERDTV